MRHTRVGLNRKVAIELPQQAQNPLPPRIQSPIPPKEPTESDNTSAHSARGMVRQPVRFFTSHRNVQPARGIVSSLLMKVLVNVEFAGGSLGYRVPSSTGDGFEWAQFLCDALHVQYWFGYIIRMVTELRNLQGTQGYGLYNEYE